MEAQGIERRDALIEQLTAENKQLHDELKRLKTQNERLMKTNRELTGRIVVLEDKLRAFMDLDG